jgi:hypothetical protein
MVDNFNLRSFLIENRLTKNAKLVNEAQEKKVIKVLKDLYYFDKVGGLSTKDGVDQKHHEGSKLTFKKGKVVQDDSEYDDSEYKMIVNSSRLKKGEDYEIVNK